ncbi:hypothetical protein [Mycobacterium sp. MAA66]|uniref:hypothetical protein n=1 Tax=Mycobacterium sp. MAA66 TaxID=3156297 RepID=UPI0035180277
MATIDDEFDINAGDEGIAEFHTLVVANGKPEVAVKDESACANGATTVSDVAIARDAPTRRQHATGRVSAVEIPI